MSRAPRRKIYVYEASNHPDPIDVTKAIVNGVDISLIDPQLYPDLRKPLQSYILKFQDRNDQPAVQRLEFVIDYMNKYPERERISQSLMPRETHKPQPARPFTDDELENELDNILDGSQREYTPEEQQCIIDGLRKRKMRHVQEENYLEANKCETTLIALLNESEFADANRIASEQVKTMNEKYQESQDQLKNLRHRWAQLKRTFEAQSSQELQDYQSELQAEIDECARLRDQEPEPQYTKYSPQYWILRRKEQSMVNSKRYIEAENMKQEVLALKREEDRQHLQTWEAVCADRLEKCQTKCQQKYRVRQARIERDRETMLTNERKEIDQAEKNVAHLEFLIQKSESVLQMMESSQNNKVSTRSALPTLQMNKIQIRDESNPISPAMFSQRRMLNYRLYSKRPMAKSIRTAR